MSSSVVKFYPSSAVLRDLLLPEPGEEKFICARANILYYGEKGVEMLDCVCRNNNIALRKKILLSAIQM